LEQGKEQQVSIPESRCEFWLDPADNIHMALPNDHDGNFWCMYDGHTLTPTANPKSVWEALGWKFLDPVVRSVVEDSLTVLD
jgi:hypothetical protein